jgi:hypothetical protein
MQLLRNYVVAIPNYLAEAGPGYHGGCHKSFRIIMLSTSEAPAVPSPTTLTLKASGGAAGILRTVIGRGLLALCNGLPMLGVLRSTPVRTGANNWEFNGEPPLKLQL